jgi:hypothetical protein
MKVSNTRDPSVVPDGPAANDQSAIAHVHHNHPNVVYIVCDGVEVSSLTADLPPALEDPRNPVNPNPNPNPRC